MRLGLLLALLIAAIACIARLASAQPAHSPSPTPPTPAGIRVVVTVPPLKGLVEPLLAPGSTIKILMKPGHSEHAYEFTPADRASLASADMVVYVGLGLEPRIQSALDKHPSPARQVVGFADAVGIKATDAEHDHAKEADHRHHGAIDPHLWLDPALVEKLIPKLRDAIQRAELAKAPAAAPDAARLDSAAAALITRVQTVDKEWTTRLEPFRGRAIVTHHKAFDRPAQRYGLIVAAVIREFEGSEPTPAEIANVVAAIQRENVRVIFIEPQFNPAAAERIARRAGVRVGTLDPLGDGDWFGLMAKNLDSLTTNLAGTP
jgi:zinc transport system substrate-binding protein